MWYPFSYFATLPGHLSDASTSLAVAGTDTSDLQMASRGTWIGTDQGGGCQMRNAVQFWFAEKVAGHDHAGGSLQLSFQRLIPR